MIRITRTDIASWRQPPHFVQFASRCLCARFRSHISESSRNILTSEYIRRRGGQYDPRGSDIDFIPDYAGFEHTMVAVNVEPDNSVEAGCDDWQCKSICFQKSDEMSESHAGWTRSGQIQL